MEDPAQGEGGDYVRKPRGIFSQLTFAESRHVLRFRSRIKEIVELREFS